MDACRAARTGATTAISRSSLRDAPIQRPTDWAARQVTNRASIKVRTPSGLRPTIGYLCEGVGRWVVRGGGREGLGLFVLREEQLCARAYITEVKQISMIACSGMSTTVFAIK